MFAMRRGAMALAARTRAGGAAVPNLRAGAAAVPFVRRMGAGVGDDPVAAGLGKLAAEGDGKAVVGDSKEMRNLAEQARAGTLLSPGDEGYDEAMAKLWGGPPPKYFEEAMKSYKPAADAPVALVTGGGGGIGFYISKGLAQLGFHVIIPARPGPAGAESQGAMAAIMKQVSVECCSTLMCHLVRGRCLCRNACLRQVHTMCTLSPPGPVSQVPGAKVTVPTTTLDLNSLSSVRSFCEAIVTRLLSPTLEAPHRPQLLRSRVSSSGPTPPQVSDAAVPKIDVLALNAGRGGGKDDPREETSVSRRQEA